MALEISLRLFTSPGLTPGLTKTHPTRRYVLKPGFVGKTNDATIKINSYGLRDFERPITEGDAAYRIAVFGDSMTFGNGVEMELTFPKVLEKKIITEMRIPVQVFNLGVPSYNTVSEYYYLKESYHKLKPHMVIVQYSIGNDTGLTNPPGSP